jgi:hypothetical protein
MDAFTVDTDLIDDGEAVGRSWSAVWANAGEHGVPVVVGSDTPGAERWHAKDDDGEHYYSGWLVGDAWEVISDWAAGYAGCTVIYDGQWRAVI